MNVARKYWSEMQEMSRTIVARLKRDYLVLFIGHNFPLYARNNYNDGAQSL